MGGVPGSEGAVLKHSNVAWETGTVNEGGSQSKSFLCLIKSTKIN